MSIYSHLHLFGSAINALDDGMKALFRQIEHVNPIAIPFLIIGGIVIAILVFGLGAMENMSEKSRIWITVAIVFVVIVFLLVWLFK
jgi:hypothetical protein